MMKARLSFVLFLLFFVPLLAQSELDYFLFPVATDSTVDECEPYLTYFWYSGAENQLCKSKANIYYHIWLTYVTRDYSSNTQQIIAANLGKDSLKHFTFSKKYVLVQSQTARLSAPKIENFIKTPVAIWAEETNNQSALKYAVFLDSSWSEPLLIVDGLPPNSPFIFYSKDSLKDRNATETGNSLFFTNGKDLYQAVLDSSFQFKSVQLIFTADSAIKQLDFARQANGTYWLVFLINHSFKALFKRNKQDDWQGPFLLTTVLDDFIEYEVNYTNGGMTLVWADTNKLNRYFFYLQEDSLVIEPEECYDFSPNSDALLFAMNTFVVFECFENPENFYVFALQNGQEWYLTFTPYWSDEFQLPFPVKKLCISGNDDQIFIYVWETPGPDGSDLYAAFDVLPSALEEEHAIRPTKLQIGQNYPNPFNAQTTIPFYLPTAANVAMELLNIRGQKIKTIFNRSLMAGHHSIVLNGNNLASGIYFIRLRAGNYQQLRKCVLLK